MDRLLSLGLYLALIFLFSPSWAVEQDLFYPYGQEEGDNFVRTGDDESSPRVSLSDDIVLYNKSYGSLFVNTNGLISFERWAPVYDDTKIPLGTPAIAIFLADVDTTDSGIVYYRSTTNKVILDRATYDIREYFSDYSRFTPTSIFLATWDRVAANNDNSGKVNTFQVVIVTDGSESFCIFHYLDDGIQWIQAPGKSGRQDMPAYAGFDSGMDGLHYSLPGSGSSATFARGSNVNFDGVWMYHIGNTGRGNIQPADRVTETDTIFDPSTPLESCRDTASTCHPSAKCFDNENGFCCQCIAPYYGNGIDCLEPEVPQKVNGIVSGKLNGAKLDTLYMHTYVVTSDGRTYTAIRPVPDNLGPALLTLNSVGGIVGWMFAKPVSPKAKNGYHFTGGRFNRTAKVSFKVPGGADKVIRLTQIFSGHDIHNKVIMETHLEGDLPQISTDQVVTIDDYTETYNRVAPGVIKSFVDRTYRVNDVAYRYTWDNTISFEECQGSQPLSKVMRSKVYRHYVWWDPENERVRIAMTSQVGSMANEDPCHNNACARMAECRPTGDHYQCVCRPGYQGDGETCTDIDECERNSPCDVNAQCYNTAGSFTCRCGPGYTGDGITCRDSAQVCGDELCSPDARCVFADGTQQPSCQCNAGFRGDGVRCQPLSTDDCRQEEGYCGPDAQCVYDEDFQRYSCESIGDYSGDGEGEDCDNCDRNAECVQDSTRRGVFSCQCRPGYQGDGRTCSRIDICDNCDRNARCVMNERTSDYECRCERGYRGDGERCERRDCREDESMCASEGGLCWNDVRTNVSFCRCTYGYRGDGFRCEQLSCDQYNDCDQQHGKCVLVGDSFRCVCDQGYEGDGKRCTEERLNTEVTGGCEENNYCDVNAVCVRNPRDRRQYICQCRPGYQGDGKSCTREDIAPCNQVNNCDRHADCMYDPDRLAYRCVCGRGYQGNGLQCQKKEVTDCRRQQYSCGDKADCVPGTDDDYVCVCRPGYRGDGNTCSPVVREGNFLIYAQGNKLMRVNTEKRPRDYGQQLVFKPGMLAIAVTTDCATGDLYWTDVAQGAIHTAKSDGSGVRTVVTDLSSPEGIAVDHSGRNMFFTDSNRLMVAKLDGSDMKTLVDTDMRNARAVVLDVRKGVVYWTDWNRELPQIERINMDGTEREVLVKEDIKLPNGLAFDSYSQTLCWGDAGKKRIECIRTDGVGRRLVLEDSELYPFDLAMLNNVIYWTDWQINDIPNVNINGNALNEPISLAVGGNGKTYGITAVRDRCPSEQNSCRLNNGGCDFLCLPSARGGRTCACPDGVDPRICQR